MTDTFEIRAARIRRATWDARFLALARHVAGWSKDPSTQCGAVVVDPNRVVLGLGYNGFPRGVDDGAARYADRAVKYQMVVHAEPNAILNASGPVRGATLYVWPFMTCAECAKLVIQAGIARVVVPIERDFQREARWGSSIETANAMYREAGVKVDLAAMEAAPC